MVRLEKEGAALNQFLMLFIGFFVVIDAINCIAFLTQRRETQTIIVIVRAAFKSV